MKFSVNDESVQRTISPLLLDWSWRSDLTIINTDSSSYINQSINWINRQQINQPDICRIWKVDELLIAKQPINDLQSMNFIV